MRCIKREEIKIDEVVAGSGGEDQYIKDDSCESVRPC